MSRRYELASPRPHPIGKVVNAATAGGGILGTLVLVALGIMQFGDLLDLPRWVFGVAAIVAFVGGSKVAGHKAQASVEAVVTPLSDPQDADGRKLIPVRPPRAAMSEPEVDWSAPRERPS